MAQRATKTEGSFQTSPSQLPPPSLDSHSISSTGRQGSSTFPPRVSLTVILHDGHLRKGLTSCFLCLKPSMAPRCLQERASALSLALGALSKLALAGFSELHFSYFPPGTLTPDSSAFPEASCPLLLLVLWFIPGVPSPASEFFFCVCVAHGHGLSCFVAHGIFLDQ